MARRAKKNTDKAPRSNRRSASPPPTNRRRKRAKRPPGPGLSARLRMGWERFKARTTPLHRPLVLLLKTCVVFAAAAGAIAVGRLVEQHVRSAEAFATVEIDISGLSRLQRDGVLSTAGLAIGQNVFEVSPEQAERRLTAEPWIASASVRRRLPGTYSIEIRERRPVALLAMNGTYLVADDGTLFKAAAEADPVDLPVITGIDRADFTSDRIFRTSVLVSAVALLHDYRDVGLWRREPIQEIHAEKDQSLSLYVGEDSTYVRLGKRPYRAKFRRLRKVLDRLAAEKTRAAYVYLDNVRRPDRVTVRLR